MPNKSITNLVNVNVDTLNVSGTSTLQGGCDVSNGQLGVYYSSSNPFFMNNFSGWVNINPLAYPSSGSTLNIPPITNGGTDTMATLASNQTFTGTNTFQAVNATSLTLNTGQALTTFLSGSGSSAANHTSGSPMSYAYQVITGVVHIRLDGLTFTPSTQTFYELYEFPTAVATSTDHYGTYPYQEGTTWYIGNWEVISYAGSIVIEFYTSGFGSFSTASSYTIPQFTLTYIA
jgi:hypothetical protein